MRWKQIVGRLVICSLIAGVPNGYVKGYERPPACSSQFTVSPAAARWLEEIPAEQTPQSTVTAPNALIRRVVILRQSPTTETRVLDAVESERAMRMKPRRRSQLFSPRSSGAKPGGVSPLQPGDAPKSASKNPKVQPHDDSSMTVKQLEAIGEILFEDSLIHGFQTTVKLQIVPESDVEDALKTLGMTRERAGSLDNANRLCARLQCDAVLVPHLLRIRLREGDTRDLAFWASVSVYRSSSLSSNAVQKERAPEPDQFKAETAASFTEYPVSGYAVGERAPFQSQYLKDWTQLINEAGEHAAGMASQTFLTGTIAPFARQSDTAAVIPVVSPVHADALIFKTTGRRVIPNALTHLSSDVSARFHPPLLPLFDDEIRNPESVKRILAAQQGTPDSLWTKDEMPDTVKARLIGMRMKADYVLMARIGDLEIAQEMGRANASAVSDLPQTVEHSESRSASRPNASQQVSARAEAIGAFVRVSDGALLWHERTTATSTRTMAAGTPEGDSPAARRAVSDATHFALLQLERRFRQYRSRYER